LERKAVIGEIRERGKSYLPLLPAKVQKMGKVKEESETRARERERERERETRYADGSDGASKIEKGKRPKRSDENLISSILEKAGGALRRHYGTLLLPILLRPSLSHSFPLLPRR